MNKFKDAWLRNIDDAEYEKISTTLVRYNLTEQDFEKWFINFSRPYIDIALKIFYEIDYIDFNDFKEIYENHFHRIEQKMHQQHLNKIIYVISDKKADSSTFLAYLTKYMDAEDFEILSVSELKMQLGELREESFFVFLNDTHGTGNQFIREFELVINDLDTEQCAIVALAISFSAMRRFHQMFDGILCLPDTPAKDIDDLLIEKIITRDEKEKIIELGELVYAGNPLGYKNTGLMVAYSHQCPNNTLPIIWAHSKSQNNLVKGEEAYPWTALFEYKSAKDKILKIEKARNRETTNDAKKKEQK